MINNMMLLTILLGFLQFLNNLKIFPELRTPKIIGVRISLSDVCHFGQRHVLVCS